MRITQLIRSQEATSRMVHLEQFRSSSFVIRLNLLSLNHPCSFSVHYYLFSVFLLWQTIILRNGNTFRISFTEQKIADPA